MGIKGFTKFINDSSHLYFEDHQLHDCNILIDGHSISCQLYNWKHWEYGCKSVNSYGGDYDKYAHIVEAFFEMLEECKINPYVVFDGGYEQRKLPTILNRMQDKIKIAETLSPESEVRQPNKVVFPLFLRETFKDVLRNRDIKVAMCEYEGDTEIASIAKLLKCPVLTFDSDYFIFGAKYIPFVTLDGKVKAVEDWRNGPYKHIPCKMYRLEKFLEEFKGLDKNKLTLLPVLLGNDYIDESMFLPFLETLNIGFNNNLQERIQLILGWLKEESMDSAIKKILGSFKSPKKKLFILKKIEKIVSGYYNVNSKLIDYFGISPKDCIVETNFNFSNLKTEFRENIDNTSDNPSDESDCEESNLERENTSANPMSKLFLKHYIKCQYPSSFMDILTQNKYYCIPQVENHAEPHSHNISLDLLSAIHKILTNSEDSELTVISRDKNSDVKFYPQPKISVNLPCLEEVKKMNLQERKGVFQSILEVDGSFMLLLDLFPIEWHLFLLSLKYAVRRATFDAPILYSLILSFIVLNYIDQKLGFYRSEKTFKNKFYQYLQAVPHQEANIPFRIDKNCFYYFTKRDGILFMDKMVRFFNMDPRETEQSFDRSLVHSMAQLQSVFLHIKYLNSILNTFPSFVIHMVFSGTFIYNVTKNFRGAENLENGYLEAFMGDCPSILAGLKYALNILNKQIIL